MPPDSGLKRVNSLPARLPSNALQQTEVKPVRKPVTRPMPDTRPPEDFRDAGGPREAAELKMEYMKLVIERNDIIPKLAKKIENSPYYMDLIKTKHPDIGTYSTQDKHDAYCDLANRHPKLLAWHARERNRLYTIPNGATSSRTMAPDEQRFLTQACNALQRDLKENPFHIHGDMGVKGNKEGFLTGFSPNLKKGDSRTYTPIDKYELHTRAPFMGPFTSSASETDHRYAAMLHLYNNIPSYITNGKDVLHIQPDRMGLVKLHPDPNVEKELGPFPKDFGVPAPQQPPRPFSNHEAPAALGKD